MEQDEVFEDLIRNAMPDQVITNFIIIAEVADEEGRGLVVSSSPGMTPWLASGMVEYAVEIMESNGDD